MRTRLVLVHSPLVGCGTWQPAADDLAAGGYEVAVPDLAGAIAAGPPYHPRLARLIAGGAAGQPVILVAHSRAGPLLPAAGTVLGEQVSGYVFVDTRLPAPGRAWADTMAPALVARLRDMAGPQGWLPPWPQWWGDTELAALLPDPAVRQRFVAGCPRLPMAMLEETYPPAPDWPAAPCGYLQLSEAYQNDAASARELGWPVRHLPSHHLGLLTEPAQVGRELVTLIGEL